MKPSPLAANLALLTVNLMYGINYSVVKIVLPNYIKPFGFILYRVLISCLVFWILHIGSREKIDWKTDGTRIVLCALFGAAANQLIFFKAISITSAVNGSIIMTLIPIFVYILSIFILSEKLRWIRIVGILLGLTGAVMIIIQSANLTSSGNWIGDILIIFNALAFSFYLVLVKPLMRKYSALTITKWIFSIGIFMVLPFGFQEAMEIRPLEFTVKVWWSIVFIILGVTVLVYFLSNWAMRTVNPTLVGAYVYTQPVFATFIAVVFFGEMLSLQHISAAIMVFSGVYLVGKRIQ